MVRGISFIYVKKKYKAISELVKKKKSAYKLKQNGLKAQGIKLGNTLYIQV